MPKKAHQALKRQAEKKGLTGKAKARYVHGAPVMKKHKKKH